MIQKIPLLALVIFSLMCGGCASLTRGPSTVGGIHGCFCGKGRPDTSGLTDADAIEKLLSIKPLDDIDKVCKIHDLCYRQDGTNNAVCDDLFIYLMNDLSLSLPLDCLQLAQNMPEYFRVAHPNRGSFTGNFLKLINPFNLYYIIFSTVYDIILYPLVMLSNIQKSDKCLASSKLKSIRITNKLSYINSCKDKGLRRMLKGRLLYYEELKYAYEIKQDLVDSILHESVSPNLTCKDLQ